MPLGLVLRWYVADSGFLGITLTSGQPFLIKLQEKAKWSIGTALSQLLPNQLDNASELLEAANSLQGPSPFPTPALTHAHSAVPTVPAMNIISGAAPNPGSANIEFDFRPYLENQYFEPASYENQAGTGSSAESFLPPQEFEKLFSHPVRPALCPLAMLSVQDLMEDYPMELLHLPDIVRRPSSGVV